MRHETARRAGALLSTTLIGASAAIWQFGNSTIWPRCCGSVCHRWLKGARCRQKPVRVDTSADVADCTQVRPHADTAAGPCWRELLQAETGAGRCRTPAQKMLQGDTAVASRHTAMPQGFRLCVQFPPSLPLVAWHWYKNPHNGSLPPHLPACTAVGYGEAQPPLRGLSGRLV